VKKTLLVAAMALCLLPPTICQAADDAALFVQKCGSCHKRGGQGPAVNPADKAGIVWKKYFDRGRHPVDLAQTVSDSDLGVVISYLQDHAADSDQPATAVIPK